MKTLNGLKKQLSEIIICTKYFMKFAWQEDKRYFLWMFLATALNAVGPFVTIIGTKYLINEIAYESNRDMKKIIFWVIFICVGTMFYQVFKKITEENRFKINDIYNRVLATNLSMRAIKMKFAHTENTQMLDKINRAQRGINETAGVEGLMGGISSIISEFIVLSGVIYIVMSCSGWLLIPVVLSFVINTIVTMRNTVLREEFFGKNSDIERGFDYFNDELIENRYAKDVRVYDAREMLLSNHKRQGRKMYKNTLFYLGKIWKNQRVATLVSETSSISTYVILGVEVLLKRITLGEFSSLIQSTLQFTDSMNYMVRGFFGMKYTSSILKYYMEFIEEIDQDEVEEIFTKMKVPEECKKAPTIEFKNVSFKYPNTDTYVLKNVSTVIRTGEHLSIVGQNGTGKTTFIKLLCRLYDVTEGEILLNGVNINKYTYSDYVKLLSVVFQDYRLLAFTIRENIAQEDGEFVEESALSEEDKHKKTELDSYLFKLCDLGGISEWIESTDKKLDTIIYKMFDESGIEPSGGQAQKLAIVRALYKDSPIVILDEPTAALDPISEYEIYKHFDSLVGGKTAVYISHRLSSCRFCDRIIVFSDGTIIEDGSHDELMNIPDGFYAKMYNTQAKHYK